jgi:hypothetical protein
LRGKSSSSERQGIPWLTKQIWWPVEQIPMTLEVVHPRKLTALEWAVLRMLDEFRDATPPAKEVAYQLGIEDPSFLEDAIKEAVRLRALAPREGAITRDLPDLDFTSLGFELYQRGQIEAEPAEHGELFFIDALTDEAMSAPKGLELFTDAPFPSGDLELEARETIGLDRARAIVRRFHKDLLKGDGEVRNVEPQHGVWSRIAWRPVEVSVSIDPNKGVLTVRGKGLSDAASDYLSSCDPIEAGIVPDKFVSEDASSESPSRGISFDAWRSRTARTVPHDKVEAELLRLLGQARKEILAHDGWLAFPAVRSKLHSLTGEGRVVVILGGDENRCLALNEPPKASLTMMVKATGRVPAALVVDGRAGLLVESVELRVGEHNRAFRLTGSLSGESAARCREELIQAALAGLGEFDSRDTSPLRMSGTGDLDREVERSLQGDELRLAIGRLALAGDQTRYDQLVSGALSSTAGLERVPLLARLASIGKVYAPNLPPEKLTAPVIDAWRAAIKLLGPGVPLEEVVSFLAKEAPEGSNAQELVDAAVRAWNGLDGGRSDSGDLLAAVRTAVDGQWGRGATAKCPPWIEARDRLLEPGKWTLLSVGRGADLAESLLDQRELKPWAEQVLCSLTPPSGPRMVHSWVSGTERLRAMCPEAGVEAARELWVAAMHAYPGLATHFIPDLADILLPEHFAEELCRRHRSVAGLVGIHDQLRQAHIEVPIEWWEERFAKVLPPVGATTSADEIAMTAERLDLLSRNGRRLGPIGHSWAAQVADRIPKPEAVGGLTWWLRELKPLRGLLTDLKQRVSQQAARFRGPLNEARGKESHEWSECLHAWDGLGLSRQALEALIETRSRRNQGSPTNGNAPKKSKKRRKRRRR